MRRLIRSTLGAATTVLAALALTTIATPASAADAPYDVLVFSKTAGFRHDAIPVGIQTVRDLGAANNFTVTATEDAAQFNTTNLARFEAVIFLNTTGDVLNSSQQTAFESYVNGGGGYVGVHSASDTEYDWPFYGNLVGAYFSSHPAIQQATVRMENRAHPSTAHLSQSWTRTDEWYNFRSNPRSTARVLATLDESSYSGGSMGGDHPIAWCKTVSGGRSFYTAGGHTQASYSEPAFRAHLLGGIRYAAGRAKADCRPETGYTALYNGSTTGWSQAGPGGFTNSDATLTSFGGMGMLWYSAKQFAPSYSLKLDWKIAGDHNSGVIVGFPATNDPNAALNTGYEVQIDATDAVDRTTGSIYAVKAPDTAARDAALNPPGEWNTFELLVEGERLQVFLNGLRINDFTNTDPNRQLDGHIGIQNHGTGDEVNYRNIRIKELGGTTPPPSGDVTVQAESYVSGSGVSRFSKAAAIGGQVVGNIENGDWVGYQALPLTGATSLRARVASAGSGGTLQVRSGSASGPLLGQVAVPVTGGWETFTSVTATLAGVPSGTQPLYLTFAGGQGFLYDVDEFTLLKSGTPPPTTGVGRIVGLGGKCLAVPNGSTTDGTQIQISTCTGGTNQQWTVTPNSTIKALNKCLDVNGNSSADGTRIQLWTCNGGPNQNWSAQTDGSLRNPQTAKCLDVSGNSSADGQPVHLWSCHGGANQKWTLP
ncbi:Type 1 glutamine amidotransferase (GATase1) [Micromonospora phaseoli]|uniref:Type 1 glutamine amidotransferase (GATase1) n=1 Tax=Micromonospora phaseoli TaxID=1144548 RepID=A0A1H6Z841_9ACTN|nr:ThuA domain-containing protein [Micromonospora phaseoli]PZW00477.1 type 1 glutamine amidotransferase [Micromonospora phaseoli]GIJ80964.1 glycosyl hydrolase [Micromonospora phaseoli]SEJ45832.1 Type 1 glutamine amidotransferase (GATase1) [Micromonospora phaseoli]